MKPTIRLEHELLAVEQDHDVHAMLELHVPELTEATARAPLSVALVIDRSGSMSGDKLDHAKRCADFLVQRLGSDDRVALVDYDDEVRLLAPLGPADAPGLRSAIANIYAGGSTNLSGGWLKGTEELRRAAVDGKGVRRVVLFSDGQANVGVVDTHRLVDMARSTYEQGIGTSTIGFGDGFNEELMTGMAETGGGNAGFAESPDDAPRLFAQELDGLVTLAAQNLSVELRPRDAVSVLGVLHDYPIVEVAGGVQLQLGDAYGGETRRVVFRLHVPHLAALGPATIADVVLRYTSVVGGVEVHELTVPVVVNLVTADEAAQAVPDAEVVEEVVVLESARARKEAMERADRGDLDGARQVLSSAADRLRAVAPMSARPDELAEHLDEMHTSYGDLASGWDATNRKRLHFQASKTSRGARGRERAWDQRNRDAEGDTPPDQR